MDLANERRYQVFVSSTFVDLQEERRKALDAILEAQSFPAGMELFPSADDDQFEFIKREIESSDYYIVIVAGRYGSLAPDGVSFTEKEYDYAVSLAKPVMGFLHKDLGELKGKALEPDQEQRQRLQAFRLKVQAGKLVKFYSNPDELKAHVAQALNSAFRLKPQTGWVRATNARRLDDLEEITKLQKRAMELEEELVRFRELNLDPKRLLARGEDQVFLRLQLSPISEPGGDQRSVSRDPPWPSAETSMSWDDILLALFRPAVQEIPDEAVEQQIRDLVLSRIESRSSEGALWVNRIRATNFASGFDRKDLLRIIQRIAAQLLGLGYIVMEDRAMSPRLPFTMKWWCLTPEGLTHLAFLFGGNKKGAV